MESGDGGGGEVGVDGGGAEGNVGEGGRCGVVDRLGGGGK